VSSSVYKLTNDFMLFLSLIDSGARVVGSNESMEGDDQEDAAREQAWLLEEQRLREEEAVREEQIRRQNQSGLLEQQRRREEEAVREEQHRREVLRQEEEAVREEQHRREVLRQREAELLEQHRQEAELLLLEQQRQEEAAREQQRQEEVLSQRQAEQNEPLNFLVGQHQHQRIRFSPKANDNARWSEKTKNDLRDRNEEQRNYSRLLKRRGKRLNGNSNGEVQHAPSALAGNDDGNSNGEDQHAPSAAQHMNEMAELNALEREFNQEFEDSFHCLLAMKKSSMRQN
jgi:hypothetical protein